MSLINCPECGKEISDRASSCPNCGYPICVSEDNNTANTNQNQQLQEEYLVCPYCNSKELHAEQKGFSGGKAIAGGLLLGGVGLLAGAVGSKDVMITCLKCGKSFKAGQAKVIRPRLVNSEIKGMDGSVINLLKDGQVLAAVKQYKEVYNVDLKEAKEKVDAFREAHPELVGTPQNNSSSNSGCATAIIALVIATARPLLLLI